MNKTNLYLIAGIVAALVFIGFLGETEAQTFFGFSINVWIYRAAWLVLSISFFRNYYRMKKMGKESK